MLLRLGKGFFKTDVAEEFFRLQTPPEVGELSFRWNKERRLIPKGFSSRKAFHSGWTGQTLWVDPGNGFFVLVLTNRAGDHEEAKLKRLEIADMTVPFLEN